MYVHYYLSQNVGHGFGGGPGRPRIFARSSCSRAVGTERAAIATQEKCFVMARQEERPLQFQKFLIITPATKYSNA